MDYAVHHRTWSGWHEAGWYFNVDHESDTTAPAGCVLVGPFPTERRARAARRGYRGRMKGVGTARGQGKARGAS